MAFRKVSMISGDAAVFSAPAGTGVAVTAVGPQRPGDTSGDRPRRLPLRRQYRGGVAVVALGPHVALGLDQNQLRRHSDAIALLQDPSFHNPVYAQLAGDLVQLAAAAFQVEYGLPRDHPHGLDARQFGNQRIGDAIGEIIPGGVAIQVRKGQHRQGGFRKRPLAFDRRDKAVPPARKRLDVAWGLRRVTQHLADAVQAVVQIALEIDERSRAPHLAADSSRDTSCRAGSPAASTRAG